MKSIIILIASTIKAAYLSALVFFKTSFFKLTVAFFYSFFYLPVRFTYFHTILKLYRWYFDIHVVTQGRCFAGMPANEMIPKYISPLFFHYGLYFHSFYLSISLAILLLLFWEQVRMLFFRLTYNVKNCNIHGYGLDIQDKLKLIFKEIRARESLPIPECYKTLDGAQIFKEKFVSRRYRYQLDEFFATVLETFAMNMVLWAFLLLTVIYFFH